MVDKSCGRYLYRKRGVFYFSRHVPIDMRAHHGCSRIVVCLKTKSGEAAAKGSQALAQKLDDYWLLRIQQVPIPSVQACIPNSQLTENSYNESFIGKPRDELLNTEIFYTMKEAKVLIERWPQHYNTIRPHSSLGYRPPAPEAIFPRPAVRAGA